MELNQSFLSSEEKFKSGAHGRLVNEVVGWVKCSSWRRITCPLTHHPWKYKILCMEVTWDGAGESE